MYKVLWATCNLGAENPWDYGNYYAWGETKAYGEEDASNAHNYAYGNTFKKTDYSYDTYKWATNSDWTSISKYSFADNQREAMWYGNTGNYVGLPLDGNKAHNRLDAEDDAATTNWGHSWRIPDSYDIGRLIFHCYWVSVNSYKGNNVRGYVVYAAKCKNDEGLWNRPSIETYSKSTDAHIFLPAAGYRQNDILYCAGVNGNYWSSVLSAQYSDLAIQIEFLGNSTFPNNNNHRRSHGQSVRPVRVVRN